MLRSLFKRPRFVRGPNKIHNADIQTVKFGRPAISPISKFVLMGAFWFLAIRGLRYMDPLGDYQKDHVIQDQFDRAKRGTVDEEEEIIDGRRPRTRDNPSSITKAESIGRTSQTLRFTVPVWIRKGPTRPYDKSDPEFLEFVRLQTDAKRMDGLKRQVLNSVVRSVNHARRMTLDLMLVGFNGKVSFAFDIVPQVFVPPAYQVPCVWVSLDRANVDFGWRELEPDTGVRIERVFRPLVALDAASAAAKVFLYTTYFITKAKLAESLGTKTSDGVKSQVIVPQLPKDRTQETMSSTDTHSLITFSKSIMSHLSSNNSGQDTRKMHQDIVSAMPYSAAIHQAATAFNQVKTARQRAAVSRNVRGTCQVRGTITFFGTQGSLKMDVVAHYLPSENIFLGGVQVKDRYAIQDYGAVNTLSESQERNRTVLTTFMVRDMEGKTSTVKPLHKSSTSPSSTSEDKGKK